MILYSSNPQDRTVFAAGTTTVPRNDKVSLAARLEPNPDGNFVFPESDDRFTAAAAFSSVANAVATTEACWGESIQWATRRDKLMVIPDSGKDLNAFYARAQGGLFFFHDTDKVTGETVYSGRSGEVTRHEAFHAILDAKRPQYLGAWDPDPAAFHESMGDIGALALSLQDQRVIELVAQQTGGDLSKPNAAAALGEELGMAINHKAGHNVTGGAWTRNAINDFTWVDTDSLPSEAPFTQLSSEPHSLSRLWTGAMYEILTGIVNANLAQGQDPQTALRGGGEELLKMQGRLLKDGMAPEGSFRFADMARALLKSENELNQGRYSALITRVLERRQILAPDARELRGTHTVTITLSEGPFAGMEVSHQVSGQSRDDDSEKQRLSRSLGRLIANGDILMTMPNQDPPLTKPDGEPYRGVVRWSEGKPRIEPTYVIG